MLYSQMIKKAMNLAYNAHSGQLDKGGYPYITHPFHVAESMETESATIVALLHDVVEDTSITFEQIEELGFQEEIMVALKLLTHSSNVTYADYIEAIKTNAIATAVKISDLNHNMDLSRLDEITEKDKKRFQKYQKAVQKLESKI